MKKYEKPAVKLIVLCTDALMASDENEMAMDTLFDIFALD